MMTISTTPLAELNFEEMLEYTSIAIWIYDAEGTLIYVNDAGTRQNSALRASLLGKKYQDLIQKKIFRGTAVSDAFAHKKKVVRKAVGPAGQPLLCVATPIFDEHARMTNMIVTVSEVDKLLSTLFPPQNVGVGSVNMPVIFASPAMRHIIARLDKVAASDMPVMLLGETGVGKGVLTDYVHKKSQRAAKPCVIANCGAFPAELMEAEFFGCERGAFTGAASSRRGLFENASGGTLVLDEVAEFSPVMQVKLLRALQDKKIRRVGGQQEISVDVRIISATNRNLEAMMDEGSFRRDLFYRLRGLCITIPPLRERREDIEVLARHFLDSYNEKYRQNRILSEEALKVLHRYDWPGNVRELSNVLEQAVLLSEDNEISAGDIREALPMTSGGTESVGGHTLQEVVEEAEKRLLISVRNEAGNSREMARRLGVSHTTVLNKLKKYAIS